MTGLTKGFNRREYCDEERRLDRICDRLRAIPQGHEILDFLYDNNIDIRFDSDKADYAAGFLTITAIRDGIYEYGDCTIYLSERLSDDNLLQALVHEAQHMRQHFAGYGNPSFWPDEEDHCLIRRFQEADAQTVTTYIAFLLKLGGDDGPFNELLETDYAAMCDAFEKAYRDDPAALHDGRAHRAAFDAWFSNEGIMRFYDRNTITHQIPFLRRRLWENPDHGLKAAALDKNWLCRIAAHSSVSYMNPQDLGNLTLYKRNIAGNIAVSVPPTLAL